MVSRNTLTTLAAVTAILASTVRLDAYTIVFKDGSTLVAEEEFEVAGDRALVLLPSGTQTTIPLSEIDVDETKRVNKIELGTAMVIDEHGVRPLTTEPVAREPELSDLIRSRRPGLGHESGESARPSFRLTPAGNPDLFTLPRESHPIPDLADHLLNLLRAEGIGSAGVYAATREDRALVEITTNTPGEVFAALEAGASTFLKARERWPRLSAVELLLVTGSRSRAGQFALEPEAAGQVVGGAISPEDFFLQHVQF